MSMAEEEASDNTAPAMNPIQVNLLLVAEQFDG
jgi:hypothetical protein